MITVAEGPKLGPSASKTAQNDAEGPYDGPSATVTQRAPIGISRTGSGKQVGKDSVKVRLAIVDQDFSGLAVNQKDSRDNFNAIILIYLAAAGQHIDPGHFIFLHK